MPTGCPAQSCVTPTTFWMAGLSIHKTAFPKIRRSTSQTPIGRTTGCLSNRIRRHDRYDCKWSMRTHSVHMHFAKSTKAQYNLSSTFPYDKYSWRQAVASSVDWPALPSTCKAEERTAAPFREPKIAGCEKELESGCSMVGRRALRFAGRACECFSFRIAPIVPWTGSVWSTGRAPGPEFEMLAKRRLADFTLPWWMSLANAWPMLPLRKLLNSRVDIAL